MVRSEYNPDAENWDLIFGNQTGAGPLFHGVQFQRGAGLGSILRSFLQFLLPIGREVASEGLQTGQRALTKILQGEKPLDALKTESREGLKNLVEKASKKLQEGGGRRKRAIVAKPQRAVRFRRDALGRK